jgi:hypothetical protein
MQAPLAQLSHLDKPLQSVSWGNYHAQLII